MSSPLADYLLKIRDELNVRLNLRNFPSEKVEKHNKPFVEVKESDKLLEEAKLISRNEEEKCYIESSINSLRLSFTIRKPKEIEKLLTHLTERFISLRADKFEIMRKVPVEGYDFSFLVTNFHLEKMIKEQIINFILLFIQDIEKEIMDMKLEIIRQLRLAATFFIDSIAV